jgi:nitronate monooxygenase
LAARRARVVEFFYGEPSRDLVKIVHDGGALVDWQVGSRDEALRAIDAGCDFIVAQGIQAGGHVRGTVDTFVLLDEVLAAVDAPVLAAGGIGTGKTMAAALTAGAAGVRVGTRFVAATEAGAHPTYVAALIGARAEDTVYTEAFSVGWPDAPHRVLRSCLSAAETLGGDTIGETSSLDGTRVGVRRFQPLTVDRSTTGAVHAMPLWAGESVDAVKRMQPAAEIVRELADDAGWRDQ